MSAKVAPYPVYKMIEGKQVYDAGIDSRENEFHLFLKNNSTMGSLIYHARANIPFSSYAKLSRQLSKTIMKNISKDNKKQSYYKLSKNKIGIESTALYETIVPNGVSMDEEFATLVNNEIILVRCPIDCYSGDLVRFRV